MGPDTIIPCEQGRSVKLYCHSYATTTPCTLDILNHTLTALRFSLHQVENTIKILNIWGNDVYSSNILGFTIKNDYEKWETIPYSKISTDVRLAIAGLEKAIHAG